MNKLIAIVLIAAYAYVSDMDYTDYQIAHGQVEVQK